MKIQNTITQAQLEMLLRLANAMHAGNAGWRYGQSVFNAAETILPDLAEEIRGKPDLDPYNWPEDHGARWTQWYAAVCPDEPREEVQQGSNSCGICYEALHDKAISGKLCFSCWFSQQEKDRQYCNQDIKNYINYAENN